MKNKTPFLVGRRNLKAKDHWEELDLKEYRINKPVVICLGGNTTKTSASANGMCKIAESLIGLKPKVGNEGGTYDDVDLIGVSYGAIENDGVAEPITKIAKDEVKSLVYNLLLPLARGEEGITLSVDEAKRNFSNINFFSHCYGAQVVNEIVMEFGNAMLALGYKANEILEIEQQMTSVSYAPLAEVYNMPSLQIISARDSVSMVPYGASKAFRDKFYDVFEDNASFYGNYLFKEDINTLTLFTSNMSIMPTDEHAVSLIERNEFWRYSILNGDHADGVSQVAAYTLANAVAVGIRNQTSDEFIPKPTIDEMYDSCKSVLSPFRQCDLGITEQ